MKYEINIEIERTTIIGNHSAKVPETENDDDVIDIKATKIVNETDKKSVKKLKNKEQKNVGI
jgi:hypothetical protein